MIVDTDTAPPFAELQWIGRSLQSNQKETRLKIINKTVRCRGVSVDPHDDITTSPVVLDIPELLTRYFPEHGPFLGVYCIVERPGGVALGDTFHLV
jgi:uncharacterized protein